MRLRYEEPAQQWEEALPIGNGRLAGMCFGGIGADRIQINDGTFWSGTPARRNLLSRPAGPWSAETFQAARTAAAHGDPVVAGDLLRGSQGQYTQAFMPLADLALAVQVDGEAPCEAEVSGYGRELDLDTAIARQAYCFAGRRIEHEAWVSAPGRVMVVRITADAPVLHLAVELTSPLAHTSRTTADHRLVLTTRAPADVPPPHHSSREDATQSDSMGGGMSAAVVLDAHSDGYVRASGAGLSVEGASAITLVLSSVTAYEGPGEEPLRSGEECVEGAERFVASAVALEIERLRTEHIRDHSALFDRCSLRIASDAPEEPPVLTALERRSDSDLVWLQNLIFAYGRYLLICSSRAGGPPANLQGIWNDHVRPVWSSNYTLNINVEMNYWPAEVTGLTECHEPLLRFVEQLSVAGKETASALYGAPGWTAHHNSDIWCWTAPVGGGAGDPKWSQWPMAGLWLCLHLWDHYSFTLDQAFLLERAWPVMRGAVEFCLAWVIPLPDGTLGTAPATSPENEYLTPDGRPASVGRSSAMDVSLTRMLLDRFIAAAQVLDIDEPLLAEAARVLSQLAPLRIGSDGRLLEWDSEVEEVDPHHRHQSHLVGLYPGGLISRHTTPRLAEAAARSLDARGEDTTGWSLAWRVALRARLGDGQAAHALLMRFLTLTRETETRFSGGSGVYPNLFCAHPPFQVDGNLGVVAGMAELLLQCDDQSLELLPALPGAWRAGSVRGLRARGGLEVDIQWAEGGDLAEVAIRAVHSRQVVIRYGRLLRRLELEAGSVVRLGPSLEPREQDEPT